MWRRDEDLTVRSPARGGVEAAVQPRRAPELTRSQPPGTWRPDVAACSAPGAGACTSPSQLGGTDCGILWAPRSLDARAAAATEAPPEKLRPSPAAARKGYSEPGFGGVPRGIAANQRRSAAAARTADLQVPTPESPLAGPNFLQKEYSHIGPKFRKENWY